MKDIKQTVEELRRLRLLLNEQWRGGGNESSRLQRLVGQKMISEGGWLAGWMRRYPDARKAVVMSEYDWRMLMQDVQRRLVDVAHHWLEYGGKFPFDELESFIYNQFSDLVRGEDVHEIMFEVSGKWYRIRNGEEFYNTIVDLGYWDKFIEHIQSLRKNEKILRQR